MSVIVPLFSERCHVGAKCFLRARIRQRSNRATRRRDFPRDNAKIFVYLVSFSRFAVLRKYFLLSKLPRVCLEIRRSLQAVIVSIREMTIEVRSAESGVKDLARASHVFCF